MNRRTSLAASPLLATGLAALAETPSFPKIKIVQIGTRHAHASGKIAAIRSMPKQFELLGVVEPDAARWAAVKRSKAYARVNCFRGTARSKCDLFCRLVVHDSSLRISPPPYMSEHTDDGGLTDSVRWEPPRHKCKKSWVSWVGDGFVILIIVFIFAVLKARQNNS